MMRLGYIDNTIPGPHATFRQEYRFPQQFSTPAGAPNVLRQTRKGWGSQFRYLNYEGGPQAQPTQLTMIDGLRGMQGLGSFTTFVGWPSVPSTYGELQAIVLGVIGELERAGGKLVTITDIRGETRTMTAAELAQGLHSQFFEGDVPAAAQPIPHDDTLRATLRMLNSAEQQAVPWYRKRALGFTIGGILATASVAASAYHGYKRNRSVGWAVWWGFMGGLFPVITPAIALAQGFGKRKTRRRR